MTVKVVDCGELTDDEITKLHPSARAGGAQSIGGGYVHKAAAGGFQPGQQQRPKAAAAPKPEELGLPASFGKTRKKAPTPVKVAAEQELSTFIKRKLKRARSDDSDSDSDDGDAASGAGVGAGTAQGTKAATKAKKAAAGEGSGSSGGAMANMTPMQKRLFELRGRLNQGRKANKAVSSCATVHTHCPRAHTHAHHHE